MFVLSLPLDVGMVSPPRTAEHSSLKPFVHLCFLSTALYLQYEANRTTSSVALLYPAQRLMPVKKDKSLSVDTFPFHAAVLCVVMLYANLSL